MNEKENVDSKWYTMLIMFGIPLGLESGERCCRTENGRCCEQYPVETETITTI